MIRPIGPRVLIRPVPTEPEADAVIVQLDADPPVAGDVVAVGVSWRCPDCGGPVHPPVSEGMRVALRPTAVYQAVTLDGEELWMVGADDIIGVVVPEEAAV